MREHRDYRGEIIELSSIASLGREIIQPVAICDKGDVVVLGQGRSVITFTDDNQAEARRAIAALEIALGRWSKSST